MQQKKYNPFHEMNSKELSQRYAFYDEYSQ
jgi:hypothetical protein